LVVLPDAYSDVENLLREMPIQKRNGMPGLLSKGQLGEVIDAGKLKNHADTIIDITDSRLIAGKDNYKTL
jgi:hypothetical protein